MTPSRWFAVGTATGSGPEAGARAVEQALLHDDAKLLVVFSPPSDELALVLQRIRARCGEASVVGCTTAGEIATGAGRDAGLVVAALGGDGFAIRTAVGTDASRDLRAAGARAAQCFDPDEARPYRALLLLTDGLAGDQQEILRGAYGVLGAGVPLVGGCAGDDLKMTRTFQIHDDGVLSDSVVGAGIASDAPLGIGVRHGWRAVGEPMLVTHSGGNRVYTLDDRPALDVYLERLGVTRDDLDEVGLTRLALTHPLGLARPFGEAHARLIAGGDLGERSLACIAEVPQSALAWIMEGDAGSVLDATDAACRDSLGALAGEPPIGMLAFDCVARRSVLGERGVEAEAARLAASAGEAPVAGFYTYGEIARTRGMRGFHNQTLVVLSLG